METVLSGGDGDNDACHLGSNGCRRPIDVATARRVAEAGETKTSDHDVVVGVEEQVRRLDVVVKQVLVVDASDTAASLLCPASSLLDVDPDVGNDAGVDALVGENFGDDK